jgi:hypothetical protein
MSSIVIILDGETIVWPANRFRGAFSGLDSDLSIDSSLFHS